MSRATAFIINIKTRHRASTSNRWHFAFVLCRHSNATRAPTANPPNSAQLGDTPTIPWSYIRICAVVWACGTQCTRTVPYEPTLTYCVISRLQNSFLYQNITYHHTENQAYSVSVQHELEALVLQNCLLQHQMMWRAKSRTIWHASCTAATVNALN